MKRVVYTGRAKKDLKRIRNNPHKMKLLADVLYKLANNKPLDKSLRPHLLVGDYAGSMECHIENDFLLIWMDSDVITVVRIGSHSQLF